MLGAKNVVVSKSPVTGSALPPRQPHGHGHVARKGGGGQLVSRQNFGVGS